MIHFRHSLGWLALIFFCSPGFVSAADDTVRNASLGSSDGRRTYLTSWNTVSRIAREMYRLMPPAQRDKLSPQPVSLETDVKPSVKLEVYPDETKPLPMIFVSIGFIDLVNNLAHAKAIDGIEKGYFSKYIQLLSRETGEKELTPLPRIDESKFWTEDIMNEQRSNFNSIVGTIIGVNMAHHYLGQFAKYEKEICGPNGNFKPINTVLTSDEYAAAFKSGVKTALNGGCLIEGVIPFFAAFDKMPARPPWAAYLLPNNANFAKLKTTLEKTQVEFFRGNE